MSFGFGVGDFIAVGGLCWKVYKKCKDSPGGYAQLSNEVGALNNVIKETEEMLSQQDLTAAQEVKLVQSRQGCEEVLKDLEELLNKYESMGTSARRTFDRMGFGMEDMTGIRVRLISNVTMLDAFNNTSSRIRLETKLNLLIAEVRSGRREGSVISTQTFDTTARNDNETWEALRKELEDVGISPSIITEKRQFIIEWFQEAVAAGRLDEDAPSDHEDYSSSLDASEALEHENENDIAPSSEFSSLKIESSTAEQRVSGKSSSSRERRSEQSPGVPHSQSSRENKNSRSRVSYLTNGLRGRHWRFFPGASSRYTRKMAYQLAGGADVSRYMAEGVMSALLLATKDGKPGAVKALLDKGANIEAKNSFGDTALHLAAHSGHESVVRILLEKGADLDEKDQYQQTALHLAIKSRQVSVVQILLEKGANLGTKDLSGHTALHLAAQSGQGSTVVKVLLNNGADIEVKNGLGETALHLAARSGQESVVRILLSKGADMEVQDSRGNTALQIGADINNTSVVKALLDKGAKLGTENSTGYTTLHFAVRNGSESMVKLLLEKAPHSDTSDYSVLQLAAACKNESIVQILLDNGANVEVKGSRGAPPLHIAIENGSESIVQILLEKGANIDTKDSYGFTALHLATSRGQGSMVQALLKNGADLDAKDSYGYTALHLANIWGYRPIVQALLANGANLEAKDNKSRTALMIAEEHGRQDMVQLLREESERRSRIRDYH